MTECDCCGFEQEDVNTFDFNGNQLCKECHQYAENKIKLLGDQK